MSDQAVGIFAGPTETRGATVGLLGKVRLLAADCLLARLSTARAFHASLGTEEDSRKECAVAELH